jgi:hypothetical protein
MTVLRKRLFRKCLSLLLAFSPVLLLLSCSQNKNQSRSNNLASSQPDILWTRVDNTEVSTEDFKSTERVRAFSTFRANLPGLEERLKSAPMEFVQRDSQSNDIITLPLPNGTTARFQIEESPIMAPELGAKFPQLKSYRGVGLDDPTAIARMEFNPDGLSAMVKSSAGVFYVEPSTGPNPLLYKAFLKESVELGRGDFECQVTDEKPESVNPKASNTGAEGQAADMVSRAISDDKIRKYRLAVAATGEYVAAVHRPNDPQHPDADLVEDALQAIHKTINRVNLIYESELGIRLELIANETAIIYTDPAADPYIKGNTDSDAALDENQSNLDDTIKPENYDIGHVFTTGGGGRAGQPSVCGAYKAWGTTGRADPTGYPFDVDYVAHEMGHQFGASHTFNGTTGGCGKGARHQKTAYEPGSGSTIMAYSGMSAKGNPLCEKEGVQEHDDAYFHAVSLQEITAFLSDPKKGGLCAVQLTSGNKHNPVVDGGPDYFIPQKTPFALKVVSGSDADNDALTYTWEEFDLGEPDPPNPLDPNDFKKIRPIFRSRSGLPNPARTFPALANLLSPPSAGTYTAESLPLVNRKMVFRVTARDNRGRFGFDDVVVNVLDQSGVNKVGPFVVTQPQAGAVWKRGSMQTVTWDAANTNLSPIGCTKVRILLLIDGDETSPLVLADATANDNTETVTIPADAPLTGRARIKIEAVGNIFFNVSAGDIQIIEG